MAIAPVNWTWSAYAWSETLSVSGSQVRPPFFDRQAPPPAVETYRTFGSVGAVTTPVIRPEVFWLLCPPVEPGPWENQVGSMLDPDAGPVPRMARASPPMARFPWSWIWAPLATTVPPVVGVDPGSPSAVDL